MTAQPESSLCGQPSRRFRMRVVSARRAFTLIELLVVIGIIAVIMSILLPTLSRVREHATRIKCASNLRQIGIAAAGYAAEHKGALPRNETANPFYVANRSGFGRWYDARPLWQKHVKTADLFYCPGFLMNTYGGRKILAIDPGDRTQMNESKDPQVGWRVIPLDVPQDLYVSIHYSIFGGWVRTRSSDKSPDRPMVILVKADGSIPSPEPDQDTCPRVPGRLGAKNSSEIPMAADAAFRESQVDPKLSAGSMIATADKLSPTFWASHRLRGRFQGLNVLFFDGHVLWRAPDRAHPGLTYLRPGMKNNYDYLYWY